MKKTAYGALRQLQGNFDEIQTRVRAALKDQGFGIISEIDMQKAMKEKLNVDIPKYLILGACNPGFAHKSMGVEPQIGLLLPCNVIVREEGGAVEVGMVDAGAMLAVTGNQALAPLAGEVQARLEQALAAV